METETEKTFRCKCGKEYKSRSGLWKHEKKCVDNTTKNEDAKQKKAPEPKEKDISDDDKLSSADEYELDEGKNRYELDHPKPAKKNQHDETTVKQGPRPDKITIEGQEFNKFSPDKIIFEFKEKKESIASCVYGQKASGKTTSMISIIKPLKPYLDKIYVFSVALENKDRYEKELDVPKNQMFNGFDDPNTTKFIKKLIEFQEKTKNAKKILLLFDDIIDAGNKLHNSGLLDSLFANHRRYNISLFISTQQPKKISPMLRQNVNYSFAHYSKNQTVRDIIYNDYLSCLKKDEFSKLFETVTNDYNILVIEPLLHDDYISVYNSRWQN